MGANRSVRELTTAERTYIERMPKAELHVHLEGTVRPETLLDLGRHHGVNYPFSDIAGVRDWYRFRNFPHFIEVFIGICDSLLTVEDYERVTWELAEDAHRQNLQFAPVSPINPRSSAVPDVVLAGMRAGAKRGQEDFGVQMQFIMDAVRSRPREHVMAIAEWTVENLGDGLIGLGLGGTEVGYPACAHLDALRFAAERGVRLSLHAGETVGSESVWDALAAGSERIGHGVTSIHDERLVQHLVENGIVLEVSPTSNLCLGVASTYQSHPFRSLYDAGVQVTVNSDDPPMFNTDLTGEYLALATHCGFTIDELSDLSLRAVRASFLPGAERESLAARFTQEMHELRGTLFPIQDAER
jgi:aminodeoxyfutalosine deaminase